MKFLPSQEELARKRKPAKEPSKASKTPQTSAQKKPQALKTPGPDARTPAQPPCAGHTQPRSSAQAKTAASAMRKALAKEEAGTPNVRETPAGKLRTASLHMLF